MQENKLFHMHIVTVVEYRFRLQITLCLQDGGRHIVQWKHMRCLKKNLELSLIRIFILFKISNQVFMRGQPDICWQMQLINQNIQ